MSHSSDLKSHELSFDQALTYILEWETLSYSDLGTAEVYLLEKEDKRLVVVTTASGKATALPPDVFALSR